MANRYEDTTPFERDVMTSMGYHWKGEGWQKATDNGDTMVVTGWVGDIPTEPGQYTHTWDRDLADINPTSNPILREFWEEDDDGVPSRPISSELREFFRGSYAEKLKPLNNLKEKINDNLLSIDKDIYTTKNKIAENKCLLEPENLKLIMARLRLKKEKLVNVLNEVLLSIYQTEFWYTNNQIWFILSDHDFDKADEIINGKKKEDSDKIIQTDKDIISQNEQIKTAENNVKKAEDEFSQVKTAVKFTADFYKEIFKVHGEKAEQLAKALAEQAKGKKIRNADDAAKAWEKHKSNPDKKINSQDRAAITKWLESVDVKAAAENFKWFSKGMGYTSQFIDLANWSTSLYNAIQTGDWRPFFVKTETIATGMAATVVVAFAFSILIGNPVGLVMYALIMGGVGFIIDDEFVEKANQVWGI